MIWTLFCAIVYTVLLIGGTLALHIVIDLAWRRRGRAAARVFISFEHDRESIADALAAAMKRFGTDPVKLPFVKDPDHDILLDRVKQEIRDCDVFVCLPGTHPSFVESEVSMAFGLDKPLLFVVIEADTPRLPNTAKKGYPMFDLVQVQHEEFRTLSYFCSYLAADWRSTIRLCGAALPHILKSSVVVLLIYIATTIVLLMTHVLPTRGVSDTSFSLALPFMGPFLLFYGLFTMSRWANRTKLRRAISGKNFSESFLPKTLDSSLTRVNLLKILYRGNISAEHESDSPTVHNNAEQCERDQKKQLHSIRPEQEERLET
jgi:hypothetical protein